MASTPTPTSLADAGERVQPTDDATEPPYRRRAQRSGNGVVVNITAFGADYHGINPKTLVSVDVREGAIVIRPADTEGEL